MSKSICQSGTSGTSTMASILYKRAESKTWPAICSRGVIHIDHREVWQYYSTCHRRVSLSENSESSRNVLPMCYPSAVLFSLLLHHGLRIIAHPLDNTHHTVHICIVELETVFWNTADLQSCCFHLLCLRCSNSNKSKISRRCVLFSQGFIDLSSTTLASARTT